MTIEYAHRRLRHIPAGYVYRFHITADYWTQDAWPVQPGGCASGNGDKVFVQMNAYRYCQNGASSMNQEAASTCAPGLACPPSYYPPDPTACPPPNCVREADYGYRSLWTGCDHWSERRPCDNAVGDPRDEPRHILWQGVVETGPWANRQFPQPPVLNVGLDTQLNVGWWAAPQPTGDDLRPTWGSVTVTGTIVPVDPLVVYLSHDCSNPLNEHGGGQVGDCDDLTFETGEWIPRGRDGRGDGSVWLVARWLDPATRPASAEFALQSSSWPGHAINYPPPDAPADEVSAPDLSIEGDAVAPFDARGVARVRLRVTDWAARGTAEVTAGALHRTLRFPVDDLPDGLGNLIADAAWMTTSDGREATKYWEAGGVDSVGEPVPVPGRDSDLDVSPWANGVVGDAFTAWEEYRGVVINRKHRRLDPWKKDVFWGKRNWPDTWREYPVFDAVRETGLLTHEIFPDPVGGMPADIWPETRIVNHRTPPTLRTIQTGQLAFVAELVPVATQDGHLGSTVVAPPVVDALGVGISPGV